MCQKNKFFLCNIIYFYVFFFQHWLDLEKPLNKQIGLSLVEPLMKFCVKFYTPDPAQLEEEYTRYLFCLQIKRDLSHGHMQCNDNTAALMASYIVQGKRMYHLRCIMILYTRGVCVYVHACSSGSGFNHFVCINKLL